VFLSRISNDHDNPRFGRRRTLVAQNPTFPQCLQEGDIGTEPLCELWPSDSWAWSTLSTLFFDAMSTSQDFPTNVLDIISENGQDLQSLNAASDSTKSQDIPERIVTSYDQFTHGQDIQSDESDCADDTAASETDADYEPYYEVWSLLRTCAGLCRSQHHRGRVAEFLKTGGFLDTHVAVSNTGQYVRKASLERLGKEFSLKLSPNSKSVYSLSPIMLSILQPIRPINVLEMIPIEDLEIVSPRSSKLKSDTARYA
jgi:hypothetical protein